MAHTLTGEWVRALCDSVYVVLTYNYTDTRTDYTVTITKVQITAVSGSTFSAISNLQIYFQDASYKSWLQDFGSASYTSNMTQTVNWAMTCPLPYTTTSMDTDVNGLNVSVSFKQGGQTKSGSTMISVYPIQHRSLTINTQLVTSGNVDVEVDDGGIIINRNTRRWKCFYDRTQSNGFYTYSKTGMARERAWNDNTSLPTFSKGAGNWYDEGGLGTTFTADAAVYLVRRTVSNGSISDEYVCLYDGSNEGVESEIIFYNNGGGVYLENPIPTSSNTGIPFKVDHWGGGRATCLLKLTAIDPVTTSATSYSARSGTLVEFSENDTIVDDGQSLFYLYAKNGAYTAVDSFEYTSTGAFPEITYSSDGVYCYAIELVDKTVDDSSVDNLIRAQYTPIKFNTKADGTGTSYAFGSTVNVDADLTLYVIWKRIVVYNANGHGTAPATQEHGLGSTTSLASINDDDWGFLGWYDASSGGNRIGGAGTAYTGGSVDLYAHWRMLPSVSIWFTRRASNYSDEGSLPNISRDPLSSKYTGEVDFFSYENSAVASATAKVVGDSTETALDLVNIDNTESGTWMRASGFLLDGKPYNEDFQVVYTVTDSDGFSNSETVSVSKASDYTMPAMTLASVERCDSNGDADDEGKYLKVVYNVETVYYSQSKVLDRRVHTEFFLSDDRIAFNKNLDINDAVSSSTKQTTITKVFGVDPYFFDENTTYKIKAYVSDGLNESPSVIELIPTAFFTMDVLGDGYYDYVFSVTELTSLQGVSTASSTKFYELVSGEYVDLRATNEVIGRSYYVQTASWNPETGGYAYGTETRYSWYKRTEDTEIVSGKTYYTDGLADPNNQWVSIDGDNMTSVSNPVQDDLPTYYEEITTGFNPHDNGWYERTATKVGEQPGHGISFGAPCKHEGHNVSMHEFHYELATLPVYKGDTAPDLTNPNATDMLWIDTSAGKIMKYHNGTDWVCVGAVWG